MDIKRFYYRAVYFMLARATGLHFIGVKSTVVSVCPAARTFSGVFTGGLGVMPPRIEAGHQVGPHFSCSNFTCSKLGLQNNLIDRCEHRFVNVLSLL